MPKHDFFFQMVDRLDEGAIAPDLGPLDYKGLYKAIYVTKLCLDSGISYISFIYKLLPLVSGGWKGPV